MANSSFAHCDQEQLFILAAGELGLQLITALLLAFALQTQAHSSHQRRSAPHHCIAKLAAQQSAAAVDLGF